MGGGRGGAAGRRACWRRCCCRRVRFASGAGRSPLVVAAVLTAVFVGALAWRFDLIQASALYGLRLELPPLASPAGIAHVLAFFGWTFATVELIADKGGHAPRRLRPGAAGAGRLRAGVARRAVPVAARAGGGRGRRAARAALRRPRPCRASASPSGARSSAGWRRASATAPVPTRRRPEAVVVEEGELEVSRIQTHRRGQPVIDQADAQARHAGRARRELRRRRPRRRRREHRTAPALAGAQPRAPAEAAAREDRRRVVRSEVQRARRRAAGRRGAAPPAGTPARATACSRSGGAAPPAISSRTRGATRPAAFAGQVDGAAPVQSIVEIVDMLADLVDASMPAAS